MRLSKRRVPFSHIMIPHSAPIVKHIYQFSQIFFRIALRCAKYFSKISSSLLTFVRDCDKVIRNNFTPKGQTFQNEIGK